MFYQCEDEIYRAKRAVKRVDLSKKATRTEIGNETCIVFTNLAVTNDGTHEGKDAGRKVANAEVYTINRVKRVVEVFFIVESSSISLPCNLNQVNKKIGGTKVGEHAVDFVEEIVKMVVPMHDCKEVSIHSIAIANVPQNKD